MAPEPRHAEPAGLGPVRVPSAVDQVADRLLTAIALGEFSVGERLPPERELAETLGVGRVTVRAAFARLREVGCLEVTRGRLGGHYVRSGWRQESATAVRRTLLPRWEQTEALLDTRALIESLIARTAAERRDAEDIARIESALAAYAEAVGHGSDPGPGPGPGPGPELGHKTESASTTRPAPAPPADTPHVPAAPPAQLAPPAPPALRDAARLRRTDSDLHRAIARAAKNEPLARYSRQLLADISAGFPIEPFRGNRVPEALADHRELVRAITDGDADTAARVAARHFTISGQTLRTTLERSLRQEG